MQNVKCPECGAEFMPSAAPLSIGKWTATEDEQLLHSYQVERKLLSEIAADMNRTQDAVRNRLYCLRGAGKKSVNLSVALSAAEYDEMREAHKTITSVNEQRQRLKSEADELREICDIANSILVARKNHKHATNVYEQLETAVNNYFESYGVF